MTLSVGYMNEFPDFNAKGFDIVQYNQRFEKKNIIIHAHASKVSYPSHWGPLSIKCAFGGSEQYQSGARSFKVNENHFLVMNQGTVYSSYIDSQREVESFTLNITPEFERTALQSILSSDDSLLDDPYTSKAAVLRLEERVRPLDSFVVPTVRKIRDRTASFESNVTEIEQLFFELVEGLCELQRHDNNIARLSGTKLSTREEIFRRLKVAKELIDTSYSSPLTIADLSRAACMNEFHFLRQFKRAFRMTPHQLIIQCRLNGAARMLRESDLTVAMICLQVGFIDAASFSKLFRSRFGVSPNAYRDAP